MTPAKLRNRGVKRGTDRTANTVADVSEAKTSNEPSYEASTSDGNLADDRKNQTRGNQRRSRCAARPHASSTERHGAHCARNLLRSYSRPLGLGSQRDHDGRGRDGEDDGGRPGNTRDDGDPVNNLTCLAYRTDYGVDRPLLPQELVEVFERGPGFEKLRIQLTKRTQLSPYVQQQIVSGAHQRCRLMRCDTPPARASDSPAPECCD